MQHVDTRCERFTTPTVAFTSFFPNRPVLLAWASLCRFHSTATAGSSRPAAHGTAPAKSSTADDAAPEYRAKPARLAGPNNLDGRLLSGGSSELVDAHLDGFHRWLFEVVPVPERAVRSEGTWPALTLGNHEPAILSTAQLRRQGESAMILSLGADIPGASSCRARLRKAVSSHQDMFSIQTQQPGRFIPKLPENRDDGHGHKQSNMSVPYPNMDRRYRVSCHC